MKKFLGSLLLTFIVSTNWVSAQCPAGVISPSPTCIEVAANGDITVKFNPLTSNGTLTDIDAFELYNSKNGFSFPTPGSPTVSVPVPGTGPWPVEFNHVGADGANDDNWYFIVTVCNGVRLANSDTIRAVRLTGNVVNDQIVNLNWNWDSLTISSPFYDLQRELPFGSGLNPRTTVSFTPRNGVKGFTDTIVSCGDTATYKLYYTNLDDPGNVCVSESNELPLVVQDQTPPEIPVIDTVSFDPVSNRPLITWDRNAAQDVLGYVVLFHPNNDCQNTRVVDTVPFNTTKTIDNLWYNGINPGQYAVYAFDNCVPGPFSISQKSNCVSSMQLSTALDMCAQSVSLTWTPYTGFQSGTNVLYKIFVSISGSAFVFVDQTTSNAYLHEDPIVNQILTYKIVAIENGGAGPKTTSSNRVPVDAQFLKNPDFEYLRYATVHDQNDVRLELYTDTKNDAYSYHLKRARDTTDVFNTVNIFYAPEPKLPGDSITTLSDLSALTDNYRYYYEVDIYDSCGNYMSTSNYASTMLLDVTVDNVRRVNRLEWTNVEGWAGGTFAYKVYRFLDGELLDQEPITKFPDSAVTTVYYDSLLLINDNITQGNPSQGEFCYYIEAIENEPTFKGVPPALSYSNEVCVVQQPYFSSPNAFTPNGDGRNEKFRPVVTYHDFSYYEFYVMNRHGEIVYQTNNVKAAWDGTFKGNPAPQGVYVYSVKYRASTGEQFEEKGTISLLR